VCLLDLWESGTVSRWLVIFIVFAVLISAILLAVMVKALALVIIGVLIICIFPVSAWASHRQRRREQGS
jgi:Flp pilus assembly protein TadB